MLKLVYSNQITILRSSDGRRTFIPVLYLGTFLRYLYFTRVFQFSVTLLLQYILEWNIVLFT